MRRAYLVIALLLAGPVAAKAAPADPLKAAQACTGEAGRLERLACFDGIFGTPVRVPDPTSRGQGPRPENWRLAYGMEADRQADDGVLYRHTGTRGGQLVTLAALGTRPPRPLMTIQCHNNITELALMLPQPLASERVSLSFASASGMSERVWRVRDDGFVVSAGRGLPAIRTVKDLLAGDQVRFGASDSVLDGLLFDLSGLPEALAPLRETCGW